MKRKNNTSCWVLGISCFYHDSAACLVKDGVIVVAAQEERFSRKKHDAGFPTHSVKFCLDFAGIQERDVEKVVFYDKPLLKFERIVMGHLDGFPKSLFPFLRGMRSWLSKKLWIKSLIYENLKGYEGDVWFSEHHLSHGASAFLVSPFDRACILTVDGVGEWASATRGIGGGTEIEIDDYISYPDSLGLLYSAFTYYLGFKVNSAEYKIMGLAPYGEPKYAKTIIDHLIDIKPDGSFRLNLKYFAYQWGSIMTSWRFHELFGGLPIEQGVKPTQREMDLAASIQKITDEVMVRMARGLWKKYRVNNLCMAGGVALNCVSNSEILKRTNFQQLFIQPAAGDAGGAVGAAMVGYWKMIRDRGGDVSRKWQWSDTYLGPEFGDKQIEYALKEAGVVFQKMSSEKLIGRVAKLIAEQNIVGWFQGRMEFGPRALGNRSILADARNPKNQDRVNLKIKYRESFRPFAPSVLKESASEWFDQGGIPDQYMLMVAQVKNPAIPAVTHVDNSSRIHTVSEKSNQKYHALIREFEELTGVPVIINTSFNQRGEPIVCSPVDALNCFLRTEMDYLAIGNFLVDKSEISADLIQSARMVQFNLD
ncbi:carbamoyltransferase [Pseudomonadota bacterium]